MITAEQRAAWQALADAATPGPVEWSDGPALRARLLTTDGTRELLRCAALLQPSQADADFIAAAWTAVPVLLAALRETEAERDRWHGAYGETVALMGESHDSLVGRLRRARAERDALARQIEAVRDVHRRFGIYEHEDACLDTSDEHREEHHHADSDGYGEFYCDQMPIGAACEHCRDENGDRIDWPCPTIRALNGEEALP